MYRQIDVRVCVCLLISFVENAVDGMVFWLVFFSLYRFLDVIIGHGGGVLLHIATS